MRHKVKLAAGNVDSQYLEVSAVCWKASTVCTQRQPENYSGRCAVMPSTDKESKLTFWAENPTWHCWPQPHTWPGERIGLVCSTRLRVVDWWCACVVCAWWGRQNEQPVFQWPRQLSSSVDACWPGKARFAVNVSTSILKGEGGSQGDGLFGFTPRGLCHFPASWMAEGCLGVCCHNSSAAPDSHSLKSHQCCISKVRPWTESSSGTECLLRGQD